jgi:arylsulfatase A
MSGKWHVGLTYRNASGKPAASYKEADLRQGIADGPLNHGFDFFHGTARSHPTSSAQGWLFGDRVVAATMPNKVDKSKYVLSQTGPTNHKMAMQFLREHLAHDEQQNKPFFLYYACHSNHTKHTPCKTIDGRPVQGQSHPGGKRSDFIYENDVALGLLLEFLETEDDPRREGSKLLENTLVIFTSDNGAESKAKTATGPLRSHKGSAYEGGHRVPLIASWPMGGVGDGTAESKGQSSDFPVSLVDLFATFADVTGSPLPQDAAEDSFSILNALRNKPPTSRPPLIHHDHMEAGKPKSSAVAWLAIRADDPVVNGENISGKWKLFVDEGLLIHGKARARELYDLSKDLAETKNRIDESDLKALIRDLTVRLQDIHDRGGIRFHMNDWPH